MNIWVWVGIWAVIIAATVFAYWQILFKLKIKADRLNGQLAIFERNLLKLQSAIDQKAEFVAEPSAIEKGELATGYEFALVQRRRSKAKAARQRRLIAGLKNERRNP